MYWEYIENPNEQKNKDNAWTEISKIVCKNGGIGTFEFIKSKLVEIGYNYDNTTIKTYISKSEILPAKLNDEKIYVHPDFIYSFPNIVLVKRNTEIGMIVFVSIIKILKTKIDSLEEKEILFNDVNGELDKYELKKIGIQRFDQYIEYLKDYDAISVNNGEKYIISLNLEVANSLDLSKFGKRKEPEYRKNIRALVYDYLLKKSNFICEINELWKEFKEYMPDNISDTQFYKIINNCEFFTKISNGRNSLIQLDLSKIKEQPKAPNEEVEIPVIEEIESVELIDENNSIQKIVVNPATKINTYNTDELISKLREEIKLEYKLSDDIIDKGIANFIDTLYTKNGKSKWADSLLQSIHNIWFNNTRYYDREACLIKLTTNFESYLRISFGLESNRTGLVEVINNIQQLSDLKSYKLITKNISREDINCEKLKFSKIVNTLIWYRNLYSHNSADENLEMGQASHMKNATDFAALYIYTGYLMTI